MYCIKCGTLNEENAWQCVQCGNTLNTVVKIPTYLPQAILITVFCCMPFGIPAIVFAAQASGKISSQDIEGAKALSKRAKKWCWIAFGTGLFFWVLYIGLTAFSAYLDLRKS